MSKVQLDDVFRHGVNAVLMLLDYLLSRAPVVSYHVQVNSNLTCIALQG